MLFLIVLLMLFGGAPPPNPTYLPMVMAELCDRDVPVKDCFTWIDPPRRRIDKLDTTTQGENTYASKQQ